MSTFPPEPPTPPEGEGSDPFAAPPAGASFPPPSSPPPPPAAPAAPGGGYDAPPAPPGGGYGAAPPAGGYGGYGAPQGEAVAPGSGYADWPKRVLSALIDNVGPFIVAGIFYAISRPLGSLVYLAALAWSLYNAYLGGQTGQSYGKKMAGTRLLSGVTGQPIGGGLGIGRYFVHIIDGLPCYLGYLWPLWDAKRQTFADKVLNTVVVKV